MIIKLFIFLPISYLLITKKVAIDHSKNIINPQILFGFRMATTYSITFWCKSYHNIAGLAWIELKQVQKLILPIYYHV